MLKMIVKTAAAIAAGLLVTFSAFTEPPKKPPARPLKELAAKHNLLIGAAIDPWRIQHPELSQIILREFSSVTAENQMKCIILSVGRNDYDFGPADQVVAFAEKNKMKIRGHTLVWHKAVPAWVQKTAWTKEEMLAWLKEYITTVVGRYRGRIYCWDVVNEVFEPNGKYVHELKSIWQKICGPDYIDNAFVWAHEADPKAKLYMNDVSIEYQNRQSNAVYEWAKAALAKGVPVHGIGFQAHLTEGPKFDVEGVRRNLARFRDLGLELQFTEVDVRIDGPPREETLASQAKIYAELMQLAIEFKMPAFTVWGVSDLDSWIPGAMPGYQAALLFDKEFQPKPAYFALQEVLSTPPPKTKK